MEKDYKLYSSKAIANEFIRLAQKDNKTLTHMQLQKLIYFAHAVTLVIFKHPLVKNGFQAWPFGPVNLELYLELQGSGKNGIEKYINLDQYHNDIKYDEKTMKIIDSIYKKLGDKDGWELSKMTHQKGHPWSSVYKKGKSNLIDDNAIMYFYSKDLE
ncbi:DUF4065 domain-containing protein [Campylobacter lari]|nr:DUF4065 domain-containing protein [Campylobacter lari]